MERLRWIVGRVYLLLTSLLRWLGTTTQMIVILLALGVSIALVLRVIIVAFLIEPLIGALFSAAVLSVGIIVLLLSWRQVGTTENPYWGVVTTFGRPSRVVPTGRNWILPWQGVRRFPSQQYQIPFMVRVVTKADSEKGLDRQELEVEASVYFRWARDERLLETFLAVPVADLTKPHTDILYDHLRGAVESAFRHVMSKLTYEECLTAFEDIEDDVTKHLTSEVGNPFVELAVPEDAIDITMAAVNLPEELTVALRAGELAQREGEAGLTRAEFRGKSAAVEADGLAENSKKRVEALHSAGVVPTVAAALIEGVPLLRALRGS